MAQLQLAVRTTVDRIADDQLSVADFDASSGVFLHSFPGYPQSCPTYGRIHNANAGTQTVVLIDENGRTLNMVLSPGQSEWVPIPISQIGVGNSADISGVFFWARSGSIRPNR